MHVVPARVAGAGHGGPVRDVLFVADRQRVKVSPERDHRLGTRPHVDQQAGALGQDDRPEARGLQPELHPARRPVLVVTDLRMGMQVAPEIDELGLMPGEERVELALQVKFGHPWPPPV